jgi:hypothetical protein
MHTKSVEPGQEAAPKMETTPGESPVGLGGTESEWRRKVSAFPKTAAYDDAVASAMQNANDRGLSEDHPGSAHRTEFWKEVHAEVANREDLQVASPPAVKAPRVPRSSRRRKGGIHPSEVTTSEPIERTGHSYPNLREQRRGVVPTQHKDWVTTFRHDDKHIGAVTTNKSSGGSFLTSGNSKEIYLGGGDSQYTALTAHVQAVEKGKGRVAAEVNARRARSALSSSGFAAVKSHSTSVKGWRNYDPGHEVSAGDNGVRIEHYTGSSLGSRNSSTADRVHNNLTAYAAKLEENGFVVERQQENGKLVSLTLPNDKQGSAGAIADYNTRARAANEKLTEKVASRLNPEERARYNADLQRAGLPPAPEPVKSRGVTINESDPTVSTFLYSPGEKVRFKQKIEKVLEIQSKHAPHVVSATHVTVEKPQSTVDPETAKSRPGAYTAGTHGPGGEITLHPKLHTLRGKGDEESSGFHVPTNEKVGRFQSNFTHEIGHGVHRHLPQGGFTQELWNTIADSIGATRPELSHTTVAEMRAPYEALKANRPQMTAEIDKVFAGMTQDSVDRADALINRGTLQKWVEANAPAIKANISEYASQSPSELMAELWTEATANSNPRAAARAYAEYAKLKMMPQEYDLGGIKKS